MSATPRRRLRPASLARADTALEAVAATTLPDTEGWVSADYADRPGAEEGDAGEAGAARPSGAERIAVVADGRSSLADAAVTDECADRDEAAAIGERAEATTADAAALDESVAALTEDFADFQAEETARIAAEIEAARLAAEAEARRLAEEEAARQAAAEEAARQQAAQRNWSDGGSRPPANSGGTPPAAGGPPPGGQVGGGPVGCVADNGMGGTRPC
ncbi:hypothetical protein ACIQTT_13425 [Microbacterium sp. NPDC090225]|uniref:hypothetical protein n=1 Tax=Microbacterium sp. NPDC090225 TaxID=3364207 RepID=UPI0038070CA4